MKKLTSILLVAMLLVTCMATAAFAAEATTLTVSSVEAVAGDTVTLSFSVSGSDFNAYNVTITSADGLTLTGITQGIAGNFNYNADLDGRVGFATQTNVSGTGTLFTATFKVAEDAKPGFYAVSVSVENFSNDAWDDLTVTVVAGGVTIPCDHVWGEWVETKAASCGVAGEETRTCTVCGEKETRATAALEHSWGAWTVTKAAACGVAGEETRTCANCGETETRATAALEHKWDAGVVTTEATCATAGVKTYTCTLCGETKTEAIAATGNHTWDAGKITTEPTCDKAGIKTFTCTVCNTTKTEAVAALGHAYGEWTVTKEATCTEAGEKTSVCANCGDKKTEAIAALGHKWDEGKVTKEPACNVAGVKTYTCTVCGETKTEAIAALEHVWGTDWEKDAKNHWHVCTLCGEIKDCAAHSGQWHTVVLPTKENPGVDYEICTVCSYKMNERTVEYNEEIDPVPPTGDITPYFVAGGAAILLALYAAVSLIFKRRTAK